MNFLNDEKINNNYIIILTRDCYFNLKFLFVAIIIICLFKSKKKTKNVV